MKAPKALRQPSNWQDFESLCKQLWGEIWQCKEIKKNGRSGQNQSGVDVYGQPKGEAGYFGIQCKGKDSYTHKQFTEAEILEEIEKARKFTPPLIKFYLATTATKDVDIEAFVRKKDLESRAAKSFEIHLFSWEDIVDLIDENRTTHDWYIKSQNFKSKKDILVTSMNGQTNITVAPKFRKITTYHKKKPETKYRHSLSAGLGGVVVFPDLYKSEPSSTINKSYIPFRFEIYNNGSEPLEKFKIKFEFLGYIRGLTESSIESPFSFALRLSPTPSNIYVSNGYNIGGVTQQDILVPGDKFISDKLYFKASSEEGEVKLKWKLLSKDYQDEGVFTFLCKPEIKSESKTIYHNDPDAIETQKTSIEDLLEKYEAK